MQHDPLLLLYRAATEMPRADFADHALGLMRSRVRFASMIFGNGHLAAAPSAPRLVPLELHAHGVDLDSVSEWRAINRADKVIPVVLKAPNRVHAFHAPTLFSARADTVMRDYARRFGRQSYLIMSRGLATATVVEWCSVYRPDPDDAFSNQERAQFGHLVDHIGQALEINALLGTCPGPALHAERGAPATALAAADGRIVRCDASFAALCALQWRTFDHSRRLPADVVEQLLDTRRASLARVTLVARQLGALLLLHARATHGMLPPRRHDIATLFADGHSSKEIAQRLNLAHTTVRAQLQSAYRSLQVHTRAGLRTALRRRQEAG